MKQFWQSWTQQEKYIAIAVAALIVIVVIGLAAYSSNDSGGMPESPYAVTAQGRLDTSSETRFLVADRDGVISKVFVREGQRIAKGQILATVNCDDLSAELESAQAKAIAAQARAELVEEGPRQESVDAALASYQSASARAADAQDGYKRLRQLGNAGGISARELSRSKHIADMAFADERTSQSDLAALRSGARPGERIAANADAQASKADAAAMSAEVSKCAIRSPIDGEVLRIFKREGEFSGASQGTTLMTVGDTSRMIARMEVDERDSESVKVGTKVKVWMDAGSEEFDGHVTEISSQMGRKTARSLDPSDRFDRDVLEAIVAFDKSAPSHIVGLRVYIGVVK